VAGLALLDPAVAWGALRALDTAAEQRATARVAAPPPHLTPADAQRFQAARTETLDAEDAAANKERRLWLGLIAATEAAPGLRADAIAVRAAALRDRAPTPPDIGPEGLAEAAAEAALARGQAEAALVTLQEAAVRAATIPEDATLDQRVKSDRAIAQTWLQATPDPSIAPPLSVADAADRVLRAGALSRIDTQAFEREWNVRRLTGVLTRLEGEVQEIEARLETQSEDPATTVEVAERQSDRARDAATDAKAAQQKLTAEHSGAIDPTPSDALAAQIASTQVQLAELRVELAERALQRARQAEAAGSSTPQTTDDDIARAKAEAETAAAEAERAAEQDARDADTELRQQIAAYSTRRAAILEARKAREETAEARRVAHSADLTRERTELAAALSLGPLDNDRQTRLDDVHAHARDIVNALRSDLATLRTAEITLLDEIHTELASLPSTQDNLPEGIDSALVSRWEEDLTRLREALERDRDGSDREFHKSMALLADAKSFRRTARENASSDAHARAQAVFVDELIHEFREIPAIVWSVIRRVVSIVRHLPALVLDPGAVGAFFRGSFELLVLLFLWGFARDRSGEWLTSGLTRLQSVRPGDLGLAARINDWVGTRGVSGNWMAATAFATPVLLLVVDGLAGYLVYHEIPHEWTLIRFATFLWLARTAWLAANGLVPLLLVVPGEDRPAAREVSEVKRARATLTTQIIIGWVLLDAVFGRVALNLLDADRLHDVVAWTGTATGWVLALGLLYSWGPDLRDAVAQDPDTPLSQLLSTQSDSVLLRAPLAGLALAALGLRWASQFVSNVVEQRSGLAWVRTALARQSLKNTDDAPTRRIAPDLFQTLTRFDPATVSTDPEASQLRASFVAWQQEGRRGMVAVTGQRGSGKSRLLRRVPLLIGPEAGGLPIHRVRLDRDIFDPDDALAWLVQALGGKLSAATTSPEEAARLLVELPPSIFVIDDLHRCFLRAVGGFRGLRQVLTTMHAVSDRHFWVCAFHGDNWAFLEGVGDAVNLGVFRDRVAMHPMSPIELRNWLEAHTIAAGVRPTYDDLATEGWLGADPQRTRERARNAYFRLLAEATRGNPRVALQTWCSSLRSTDTPDTAAVVLFDLPDGNRLAGGGEHALFVLAALVVHDGLDVGDLVRVLNLDEATCRATCRRLEGLGILESDDQDIHFDITMAWTAAVHRHLRQKHLLHRE